jgi:PEP-CTERM motif
MRRVSRTIEATFAIALAATLGAAPAQADRIVGVEDSPPPFLTGFIPFDITLPEGSPFDFESIELPIGTATLPFSNGPLSASSSVALTEPGTGRISDILVVSANQTGTGPGTVTYSFQLDFLSTGPHGPVIDPPGGFITYVTETGGLQDVSDALFAPFVELTGITPTIGFLVQSDIPEPTTLTLLGGGLLGLAGARRRR